jgi:hypothetical protein
LLRKMDLGEPIHLISWSPCGRWLAVCAADLLIINVEAWQVHCRWCWNKPLVFVGFMAEPNRLAGGSADGEILLFQIEEPI